MKIVVLVFIFKLVSAKLWKNGIVHYNIENKEYDGHSQEIIISTLSKLQNEICVKFFFTPFRNSSAGDERLLYINNPKKNKFCSPLQYDFNKTIVNMEIGYKCINEKDVTRFVVDMLKASIDPYSTQVNSFDLVQKFDQSVQEDNTLISKKNRNFINMHYNEHCGSISQPINIQRRVENDTDPKQLSEKNIKYYRNKLWPLGIVLYGIKNELRNTPDYATLKESIALIELSTCVVFQEFVPDDELEAKSYLWFEDDGIDMPNLGFFEGKQHINLSAFVQGAAGHRAHVTNNLIRTLGIPMMSNRFDRDNYVVVNWRNVGSGKEQYLEKAPEAAWLTQFPYDFQSITHAPSNYMCSSCELGASTVQPIQDHLWQRTLAMGHVTKLSQTDSQQINILYNEQCRNRFYK